MKIKGSDVGELMVCWQLSRRYVVAVFGWLAVRAEGDTTRLSVSVTPSVVFWLSSHN